MSCLRIIFNLYALKEYELCLDHCNELLTEDKNNKPAWLVKIKCLNELSSSLEQPSAIDAIPDFDAFVDISKIQKQLRTARRVSSTGLGSVSSAGKIRTATAQANKELSSYLDVKEITRNPHLTQVLFFYLFYVVRDLAASLRLVQHMLNFFQVGQEFEREQTTDYNETFSENEDSNKAIFILAESQIPWWNLQLAKCQFQLNLFKDVENTLSSSVSNSEAVILRVNSLIKLNELIPALKLINQTKSIHYLSNNIEILCLEHHLTKLLLDRSLSNLHRQNIMDLGELKKRIMHLNPLNIDILSNLANEHYYDGNYEIAFKIFLLILTIGSCDQNNHDWKILNNLVNCSAGAFNYESSLIIINHLLSKQLEDIDRAECLYNASILLEQLGEISFSRECLRLTLFYNNQHAEAYTSLGAIEFNRVISCHNLQNKSLDLEMARMLLETSAEIDPDIYETHFNLCLLYYRIGQIIKSHSEAEIALNLTVGKRCDSQIKSLLEFLNQFFIM